MCEKVAECAPEALPTNPRYRRPIPASNGVMTAIELCIDGAGTPADARSAADGDAVDLVLLRRCARREPDALRALVRRHQPRVYGFLARLLNSPEDAEEAAQDVFLRVWQGADRFGGRAAVATWLYRIAANVAADRLRRRKAQHRTVPLQDDTPGLALTAVDDPAWAGLERQERARQLRDALGSLRAGDRLLLVLYYAEEKGYAELGAITGHPYPVLKMRLSRARKRLRAALDALTAEEDE